MIEIVEQTEHFAKEGAKKNQAKVMHAETNEGGGVVESDFFLFFLFFI